MKPIFIIGNQRSGTTWLYQLLCAYLEVGFIDQIAARYPDEPVLGIQMSKKSLPSPVSFSSSYGNGASSGDPHEFGWFWLRWFPWRRRELDAPEEGELDKVDWLGLRAELSAITHEFNGLPTVYKCAGMGFYAARVAMEIPEARFVHIHRDLDMVAVATLHARRMRHGSEQKWYGYKLPGFERLKQLPPLDQIARQVRECQGSINDQLVLLAKDRLYSTAYEFIRSSPFQVLMELNHLIRANPRSVGRLTEYQVSQEEVGALIEALHA